MYVCYGCVSMYVCYECVSMYVCYECVSMYVCYECVSMYVCYGCVSMYTSTFIPTCVYTAVYLCLYNTYIMNAPLPPPPPPPPYPSLTLLAGLNEELGLPLCAKPVLTALDKYEKLRRYMITFSACSKPHLIHAPII